MDIKPIKEDIKKLKTCRDDDRDSHNRLCSLIEDRREEIGAMVQRVSAIEKAIKNQDIAQMWKIIGELQQGFYAVKQEVKGSSPMAITEMWTILQSLQSDIRKLREKGVL